jgi:hypothetical protein
MMNTRSLLTIAALSTAALSAQPFRAQITGGGGDRGKCTIEVVVDGSAEIEIRGDNAFMRNLSGGPPQWRRFVCNAPMPPNPAEFRFAGVDGRGRQTLVREPYNGSPAVVRIDDPDNGREGYTFDIFWRMGGPSYPPPMAPTAPPPPVRPDDRWYRDRDEWNRGDWRARFFDRVREDIDFAERTSFGGDGDRYRLDRTRQELSDLQREWAQYHRVSRRDIDDIQALGRVVRDNRMDPRQRDILNDDLNRLREFRDRR